MTVTYNLYNSMKEKKNGHYYKCPRWTQDKVQLSWQQVLLEIFVIAHYFPHRALRAPGGFHRSKVLVRRGQKNFQLKLSLTEHSEDSDISNNWMPLHWWKETKQPRDCLGHMTTVSGLIHMSVISGRMARAKPYLTKKNLTKYAPLTKTMQNLGLFSWTQS